jgi:hypothetical protein
MTTKDTKDVEASPYATGPDEVGKPVGPEHDKSFHVEDFYDENGQRIATDWDSEAQKNDPGIQGGEPEARTTKAADPPKAHTK